MNLQNAFSKSYLLIANVLILLTLLGACRESEKGDDIVDSVADAVTDSIRKGSLAGANSLIEKGIANASDSDEYYSYMAQKGIVAYYAARPDSILFSSGAVMRYLASVPETPLRLKLSCKTRQAIAGYWNQYNFNADSALYYQKSAWEDAERSGDRKLAQLALTNLADCYRLRGDLDKAATAYRDAVELADSLRLQGYGLIPVYSGLAATYTALHRFDQSDIWWRRTGELYDVMPPSEKFYYLNNRGNDLYLSKRYEESLAIFRQLAELLGDNPDMDWERHFCSANTADVLLKLGRPEQARESVEENLRYFSEVQPNPYAYNHVLLQKMTLLMQEGRNDEALVLLRKNPSDPSMRPEQYLERYEFLKDFYPRIGQWERAYKALSEYNALNDSIRDERIRLSASEQELRYRHDSEMMSLHMDLDKQRTHLLLTYIVVGSVTLVAILLTLFLILLRRNTRLREEKMLNKIMRLRIESVRSGITPHFIYNALNQELYARERGLPGNLNSLSSLLRRQQQFADKLTAPLADELAFTDDYIAVERGNVKGELVYEKIIDEDVDLHRCQLPAMTLQILVENAFKHGLLPLEGKGTPLLSIHISHSEGEVTVTVANTTPPDSSPNPYSTMVGLKVIMATMKLLNDRNRHKMRLSGGLWTEAPGGSGYKAVITIPDQYNFEIAAKDE